MPSRACKQRPAGRELPAAAPARRALRSSLDALYRLCGAAAACFLVLLLAVIVAQMAARWTGHTFPGATSYAGYCMAASAFFALAYALDHGAHIRVNLLLSRLGSARRWGELWCFFKGLAPWMAPLPGKLLHTNIVGCTIFAAVSGSSAATLTTVGKMSIPELRARGYPEYMTIGTLAGAATLGLMIPPSLTLIVYGVSINESITRLFIAGVVPGLVLAGLFMGYVAVWSFVMRKDAPPPEPSCTMAERIRRSENMRAAPGG